MKTGIVDEDQGVGSLFLKEALGHSEDTPEARHVGDDGSQADYGEIAERIQQTTASGGHALAAEAVYLHTGLASPECVNEVGTVQIAAGFARADEQTHGEHPAMREGPKRAILAAARRDKLPGKRQWRQDRSVPFINRINPQDTKDAKIRKRE